MRTAALIWVAALAILVWTAPSANADLILKLDDLGTVGVDKTITDNMADDSDPTPGSITYVSGISGAVGAFTIQITTGLSDPFLGNDSGKAAIKVSNTSVTTNSGGTLSVMLTDTDFALVPDPSGFAILTGKVGGVIAPGGSVSFASFFDATNTGFGMGGPSAGGGPFSGAFAATFEDPAVPYAGGSFSLTQSAVLTLPADSSASFDHDTTLVTPEPGSLALLGAGVLLLAWRRRRKA